MQLADTPDCVIIASFSSPSEQSDIRPTFTLAASRQLGFTHQIATMPNVLIVGASRGLGAELAKQYASNNTVFATSRSDKTPEASKNIEYIPNIDVAQEDAGEKLASHLSKTTLDTVIITAGYFATESFDSPSWENEIKMYTTSSIAPVFIVHHLVKAGLLAKGSKIILVSSESGSITLRHESEGGGNYGHHASKSALNMVGKLLSLDLKEKGIMVAIVHPGFMRTEMTKGVGFDKFWDAGGGMDFPPPQLLRCVKAN